MIKPPALNRLAPGRTTSFFFPVLRSSEGRCSPMAAPPVWPFDRTAGGAPLAYPHRAQAIAPKALGRDRRGMLSARSNGPERLVKSYARGTHRLVLPEETWTKVSLHSAAAGVTRFADLTGLDRLGIPVYCAVRPETRATQSSYGAGLSAIDARVAAGMAAME